MKFRDAMISGAVIGIVALILSGCGSEQNSRPNAAEGCIAKLKAVKDGSADKAKTALTKTLWKNIVNGKAGSPELQRFMRTLLKEFGDSIDFASPGLPAYKDTVGNDKTELFDKHPGIIAEFMAGHRISMQPDPSGAPDPHTGAVFSLKDEFPKHKEELEKESEDHCNKGKKEINDAAATSVAAPEVFAIVTDKSVTTVANNQAARTRAYHIAVSASAFPPLATTAALGPATGAAGAAPTAMLPFSSGNCGSVDSAAPNGKRGDLRVNVLYFSASDVADFENYWKRILNCASTMSQARVDVRPRRLGKSGGPKLSGPDPTIVFQRTASARALDAAELDGLLSGSLESVATDIFYVFVVNAGRVNFGGNGGFSVENATGIKSDPTDKEYSWYQVDRNPWAAVKTFFGTELEDQSYGQTLEQPSRYEEVATELAKFLQNKAFGTKHEIKRNINLN